MRSRARWLVRNDGGGIIGFKNSVVNGLAIMVTFVCQFVTGRCCAEENENASGGDQRHGPGDFRGGALVVGNHLLCKPDGER